MSALIGIVVLALFSIALFVAIPFVLAPLVLGGMYLQRRRQLAAKTPSNPELAAPVTVTREEKRSVAPVVQAA